MRTSTKNALILGSASLSSAVTAPVQLHNINETELFSANLAKRSQTIWGYDSANCPGAPNTPPTIVWTGVTSGCYHYANALGTPQPLLSLLVWTGGYCTFRIWGNSYTCAGAPQFITDSNHDEVLECVEWYMSPQLHAISSFVAVCE
ncbi:unnamed protein product [Discula destructiva]